MRLNLRRYLPFLILLLLSGCFGGDYSGNKTPAPKTATSRPYKISNSHMNNKWFYPKQHYEHVEEGYASYYGGRDVFHGRKTSSGEIFDKNKLMAAHRTLPLPCMVRVINIDPKSKGYGRSVKVRVVDRGPFAHITGNRPRIIDVSEKASKLLGFYHQGTAKVRIETVVDDSIRLAKGKGVKDDQRVLLAQDRQKTPALNPFDQKANSPSLSVASLSFLTKKVPLPQQSPFAHRSAGQRDDLLERAIQEDLPNKNSHPSSIENIIQAQLSAKDGATASPIHSSHQGKQALQKSHASPHSLPKPKTAASLKSSSSSFLHTPSPESGIFVQTGTYSKLQNAQAAKTLLEKSGTSNPISVTPLKAKDKTVYQVRLGPLDSSEQAEYLLAQLEQRGHDGAHIVYE